MLFVFVVTCITSKQTDAEAFVFLDKHIGFDAAARWCGWISHTGTNTWPTCFQTLQKRQKDVLVLPHLLRAVQVPVPISPCPSLEGTLAAENAGHASEPQGDHPWKYARPCKLASTVSTTNIPTHSWSLELKSPWRIRKPRWHVSGHGRAMEQKLKGRKPRICQWWRRR